MVFEKTDFHFLEGYLSLLSVAVINTWTKTEFDGRVLVWLKSYKAVRAIKAGTKR